MTTLMLMQASEQPPSQFGSRAVATRAGCRFAAVKGADSESCVLASTQQDPMRVVVYDRAADGTFRAAQNLIIPSWAWGAKLSFERFISPGPEWLVIDTAGMHGTGISQRVLLLIGWDGARFRTVAAESVRYECSRPTSSAAYVFHAAHSFIATGSATMLQFRYELTRDGQRVGGWNDSLQWDAARFAFVPSTTPDMSSALMQGIRDRIARLRTYSLNRPFDPASGSETWFGDSGLLNVLDPACVD
jgi:hypothetical protein